MAERKGHFGCLGELSTPPFQRLVEVSFLPLLPTPTPTLWTYNSCQNANTALKFVIIVGVETSRYLTKMTILWSVNSLKFLLPSMGVRYDCYVQLAAIKRN